MRGFSWTRCVCLCILAACQAETNSAAPPLPSSREPPHAAARPGAYVSSTDADGVPQFLWAVTHQPAPRDATPVLAARWHLGRYAAAQLLDAGAIAAAELVRTADFGEGGILVHLRQ